VQLRSRDAERIGRERRKGRRRCTGVSPATRSRRRYVLYDRLFTVESPDAGKDGDWLASLQSEALTILSESKLEPSLATARVAERFQFERQGLFLRRSRRGRRAARLQSYGHAARHVAKDPGGPGR